MVIDILSFTIAAACVVRIVRQEVCSKVKPFSCYRAGRVTSMLQNWNFFGARKHEDNSEQSHPAAGTQLDDGNNEDNSEQSHPAAGTQLDDGNKLEEHVTLYGVLEVNVKKAQVKSAEGEMTDIFMEPFLNAAKLYKQALSTMGGTCMRTILADIEGNLQGVTRVYEADPDVRETLDGFLRAETTRRAGAVKLQWLLLGLQMFSLLLKLSVEGERNAASKAYAQTLQPYHSWITSTGVRALMSVLPGKETMLSTQELCPELTDKRRLAAAIERDVKSAVGVLIPTVEFMINACRSHGVWSDCKV